jgi:diguanylate cyclase (GGDEF)-like protein/PAS domain S-box-containing protein
MQQAGDTPGNVSEDTAGEPLMAPAAILEGLPDAVVAAGRDGRIVFVNAVGEELFGYRRDDLLGRSVGVLWPERLRERYTRNIELYFTTEHPLRFSSEAWGRRRDGSEFVGEMSWGIVETTAGPLLVAIGRDISQRRAAEGRLRALAEMDERALAGADPVDLAIHAVELLLRWLPITGAQVIGRGTPLATGGVMSGASVPVPMGHADELRIAPKRDLTDEESSFVRDIANTLATALARLRDEERVRWDAVHDPLTGLANRTLLRDRLEHALARSEREGSATGVLFIDLDNFKEVNDAHGHAAGDAVLVELGGRLPAAVRPADTVARLGGDEFVVVCEQADADSTLTLASRLLAAIALPIDVGAREVCLSASIGIALGRTSPDALLADADAAAYRAKAAGGGRLELFR